MCFHPRHTPNPPVHPPLLHHSLGFFNPILNKCAYSVVSIGCIILYLHQDFLNQPYLNPLDGFPLSIIKCKVLYVSAQLFPWSDHMHVYIFNILMNIDKLSTRCIVPFECSANSMQEGPFPDLKQLQVLSFKPGIPQPPGTGPQSRRGAVGR